MIFIQPSYEIVPQVDDLLGAYERAEIGARTCYKSENVIKKNENGRSETAKAFVEKLMNVNKHGSIGEHGAIYLTTKERYYFPDSCSWEMKILDPDIKKYIDNPYSWVNYRMGYFYITTNLRVINENNLWKDLENPKFVLGKTPDHEERLTIRFNTQIAITREANRHRANSPSEQSTRYCNYSKDKFGNEVNINVPEFVKDEPKLKEYESNKDEVFFGYCEEIAHMPHSNKDFETCCDYTFDIVDYWLFGNLAAEFAYQGMIRKGAKPEQARTVLPLDTNSELVHTAYISDWIKFLKLRCAENAHPDIRALALKIREDFKNNGWWE